MDFRSVSADKVKENVRKTAQGMFVCISNGTVVTALGRDIGTVSRTVCFYIYPGSRRDRHLLVFEGALGSLDTDTT